MGSSHNRALYKCPVTVLLLLFSAKPVCIRRMFAGCFRNRYMTFVKTAAYQFQQLRLKKMSEEHHAEQVWLDSWFSAV